MFLVRALLDFLYSRPLYVLSKIRNPSSDPTTHASQRGVSSREKEHQLGRFQNMQHIAELDGKDMDGDILEFGTWRGLGLLLLMDAFDKSPVDSSGDSSKLKFWGVDSFQGLPSSSTIWRQGTFANSSLSRTQEFLRKHSRSSFQLVEGLFSDSRVAEFLYLHVQKVRAIHFDADLGSSTLEALKISEHWLLGGDAPIYFLFDDWGCHPDEVPDAFLAWQADLAERQVQVVSEKVCSTRLTRYFRVSVRKPKSSNRFSEISTFPLN